MVKGASVTQNQVASFFEDEPLVVAHNAAFDCPFFERLIPAYKQQLIWGCSRIHIDWTGAEYGFESPKQEYLLFKHNMFYEGHRAQTDCVALAHLLALNPKAMMDLVEAAFSDEYLVRARGARFETKDALKKEKMRWNAKQKVWEKKINKENLEAFKQKLVNLDARISPEIVTIPAKTRFSS